VNEEREAEMLDRLIFIMESLLKVSERLNALEAKSERINLNDGFLDEVSA
jgi:hypothetical protein